MMYSIIILNLTIMFGSVMLKGPSPFIYFKNMKNNRKISMLPMDGWLYPLQTINDHDFKLLCEEQSTAQKVKYNFEIIGAEPVKLNFVSKERYKVTIRIKKNEEEATVHGRLCENESEMIFVMENSNYEGLILFKIVQQKKNSVVSFIGVTVIRYLSYEEAKGAAVGLFKNSVTENENSHSRLLQELWICASLFRILSSTVVQSYGDYHLKADLLESVEPGEKEYLLCEGKKYRNEKASPFITYEIHFDVFNGVETLRIVHIKDFYSIVHTMSLTIYPMIFNFHY